MRGLRSIPPRIGAGASSGGDGKVLWKVAVNLPPGLGTAPSRSRLCSGSRLCSLIVLAACAACSVGHSIRADDPGDGVPSVQPVPRSPALLAKAKDVYVAQCATCHGETGCGNGPAAYLLFPKPRNFRNAYFRLTSTDNRVPTDADLHRTITRGIPGSSMTGWACLADDVRWGLAYLVRDLWREGLKASFQGEDLEDDEAAELITELTTPGGPIAVPPVQADSPKSRAAGRELYAKTCQSCHGPEGRGDGTELQVTVGGYPISPADACAGAVQRRQRAGGAKTSCPRSAEAPAGSGRWRAVQNNPFLARCVGPREAS